jgi:predicted component of type VI protein secretion system
MLRRLCLLQDTRESAQAEKARLERALTSLSASYEARLGHTQAGVAQQLQDLQAQASAQLEAVVQVSYGFQSFAESDIA